MPMVNHIEPVGSQAATYVQHDAERFAREHGATLPRLLEFMLFHQVRHGCMAELYHATEGFRRAGYSGRSPLNEDDIAPELAEPLARMRLCITADGARQIERRNLKTRVDRAREALAEAEAALAEQDRQIARSADLAPGSCAAMRAAIAAHQDALTERREWRISPRGHLVSNDGWRHYRKSPAP